MKTRNWTLGLIVMMALLVGVTATPAQAASFSYTWGGCNGDTLCLFPVLGGIPDSIVWETFTFTPPYDPFFKNFAPPYDTCLVASFGLARDTIAMHAWFAAVDSIIFRPIFHDYMIAMSDGVTVPENGTIGINVVMNDTSSTPDSAWLQVWPGNALPASQEDATITNGPNNGTIDSIVDNTVIWYTPNPGYNGTDDFVYRNTNRCGQTDTALVAITISSDGLISFQNGGDSCWLEWIDVPCACDDSANFDGAISIGDSIRVCAALEPWDLDELTATWPKVDLPGLAGSNLTMVKDTSVTLGMLDSTLFCWPGRTFDSANTWFEVTPGNLDVAAGFYEIVVRARSNTPPNLISACTTIVDQAIDNNDPDIGGGAATWTLWKDVNGDGTATTVDTMRFFVDLRNEPFEEICQVCAWTTGFPTEADTMYSFGCLYEIAGDNRWAMVFEVPAGDLEDPDGPFTVLFRYTDNACNIDSVTAVYGGPVDNTAPTCANIETTFEGLIDLDSNTCYSLGETVRIEIFDTNTINDDVTYWLDLLSNDSLRFGLGGPDSSNITHDSVAMNNLGGGVWRLDWVLEKYPLANAVDTSAIAGDHPWVYLHAVDDAGNPFTCDSLAVIWDDPNPNFDELDARAPNPVRLDSCAEALTFTGKRAVRVHFRDTTFGPGPQDIARFRLFYDDGTGVIDYVDTLAGLSWADTAGGSGTNGIVRTGPQSWYWTTDGTVELSECRDYLFNLWVIDSCGNYECLHPDSVSCPGLNPDPITDLECEAQDGLNICLTWTTEEAATDSFCIFMASDGAFDTALWVATVNFTDTADTFTWCTDDAGLDLIEFRWYDFIVLTYDSCGSVQSDSIDFSGNEGFIAQCLADESAPVVCVFQPETLIPGEDTTIYSCDRCTPFLGGSPDDGMWIYTRPCNDTSLDVQNIDTVLIRIADSAGTPGEWHNASFSASSYPNHWAIRIHCSSLDNLVIEDDSVEVVQVLVISTDAAGRTSTRDDVIECCGYFEFVWSNYYVDVFVTTVNGNVQTYQPYCNAHGFAVSGEGNTVEVCIEAGTAPYKIRVAAAPSGEQWADETYHQVVYVENVFATCTTLSFSTVGWEKGLGELDVQVCDAAGHYTEETEIPLCVDDSIPPCAIISFPVDGKCIRRSLSMIDPETICIQIDPLGNGLDPENVLKIDYQWSQECCEGFVFDTVCFDTACPLPPGFPEGLACTTFANPSNPDFGETHCYPLGLGDDPVACTVYAGSNGLDSTICFTATADTSCTITICRLREVPCETQFEWNTFAIQPGSELSDNTACVEWWNTEDLAWITESGTIIYLRAIVYDEQGNTCLTPCVQICVDIDTPPLCLYTPDVCPSNGFLAIGGNETHEVTFYAELDTSIANPTTDDLEDVTLWFKKSSDPDLLDFWESVGSGFPGDSVGPFGTHSTMWRWDIDLDDYTLDDNVSYDWRVIAQTIWGTYSHDFNGDENFDANTFDSSACDMNTYYIDMSAPQVAMDTVWTMVDGELIVQPNVSCAMSDPRGWAWTQFGNEMTVQPNVFPWVGPGPEYHNYRDDVKRVRWTLWDSNDHNCECDDNRGSGGPFPSPSCFDEECDCVKGEGNGDGCGDLSGGNGSEGWVVGDFQGGNPMQNLTFDPSDAPWFQPSVPSTPGLQTAILRVEVWDSCGNHTSDCINIYLLDIDPTDAIIVDPMNGEVFCTGPGGEDFGGIEIEAASILEEGWNKAVFAYRAVGSSTWIEFDSVGISPDPDLTWQHFSTIWNPAASGLPDGAYELTVWAVDNALNRSENIYTITVYLSCAPPTVAVTHPSAGNPPFIGCDIELEAVASSPDSFNPIEVVSFYAVKVIDDFPEEEIFIGSDYYSVDGRWGFHWTADEIRNDLYYEGDGPYYIFARATNRAGQTVVSELVWVNVDITDPWAVIAQVNDDLSNGGSNDPTIIEQGSLVDLWGYARDNNSPWGYGAENNCGVDSVLFYVYNVDNLYYPAFGVSASVDPTVDSLYHAVWNTEGFTGSDYYVRMRVYDCACNDAWSDLWYVRLNAQTDLAILNVGPTVCGVGTVDENISASVTVNDENDVADIYLAISNANQSDVYQNYTWYSDYEYLYNGDGTKTYFFDVYTQDWPEGVYRVRAIVQYNDGEGYAWIDDFDGDGQFDDFTFNPELSHHELVRVDHGVTPFTVTPQNGETFEAHEDICFDFVAEDTCDVASVSVCSGDEVIEGSESTEFCIDPVDSSCVTLGNCGVWTGTIPVTVCDPLGHCESSTSETFWILDVAGPDTALITSPAWGSFVTPTSNNTVTARKLSVSGIDSVQFYYSTTQAGTLVYIGSGSASGDEFTAEWDVEGVAEGGYWLQARAFDNDAATDGPRCVYVTVAKGCDTFSMMTPNPSCERTINGQTFTFVGAHADLCVDREGISSITNGVGIDSIVFCFRDVTAPASTISDNLNPNNGWVRIGADIYGSLCVDWFTDWCSYLDTVGVDNGDACCSDGRYAVVAWVYDKAGNVCHSIPLDIVIDVTDPHSEIVDIDGDETFGTCHEIFMSADTVVKLGANAIDDQSCEDHEPSAAWNSGAKYLQFLVSQCDLSGTCADIVWVVDGSGSMVNQINNVVSNAGSTFDILGGVDFRMGVVTFGSEANQVNGPDGEFTDDRDDFTSMLQNALPCPYYYCGEDYTGNQTENGLSALNYALDAYNFRNNCQKIIILVTNEDADDFDDYASLFPPLASSNAIFFGVIETGDPTDNGYELLGSATGGLLFDLGDDWGARLALESRILSLANANNNDVGIVWGEQVELNDGQDDAFALWNTTGLPAGTYCVWTTVIDCAGNVGTSSAVQVCVVDDTPPVAHITGFGKSTDEHMNHTYTIYGATWDEDVDRVQFQYRPTGSGDPTAWTGIGISSQVNGSSLCWQTTWNPCALSGSFDLRAVPTDAEGNQDFEAQPIATVTIGTVDGVCGTITPSGASTSNSTIWFEDVENLTQLGLVHVDLDATADDYHSMMMGVFADLTGDLTVEKIDLWTPDPDQPSWKSGRFEGSEEIELGGEGWFWQSFTDASNRTHLRREVLTVWPVRADIGACNRTHPTLGAKVCIEPNALSSDNGIVVYPARMPTVNLSQQHFQAWPAYNGPRFLPLVTAIRLARPLEGSFNLGRYAKIDIKYRGQEQLDNSDLGVAFWDSDGSWNTGDGSVIAAGPITDTSASVHVTNLHGLYAVVSAGRVCNSGALTVENAGGLRHVGNVFGPWPQIYTTVKSNIEFNNENRDIDFEDITVVLDGNITLLANGDVARGGFGYDYSYNWYEIGWDDVSGVLTTRWVAPEDCQYDDDVDGDIGDHAPPLAPGTHTLHVLAFNRSGYCAENTYTFTVDATPPDVEVVGYEDCANPTFHIKITDQGGGGVDWPNVFVDVYDITGSEFAELPKSRLIHTESYDAFDEELNMTTGEFSFQLVSHIAQGRRLRIVIYNGDRNEYYNADCYCEYVSYEHDCDGVQDLLANNTQIVEEQYTIWGGRCSNDSTVGGDGGITIGTDGGSSNPFDPWAGGNVTFNLNGFDGGGVVTADVYDLAGVHVDNIWNSTVTSTVGSISWNGRNADGEIVAQGVYLVHFAATGGTVSGPSSEVVKVVVKRGSSANSE